VDNFQYRIGDYRVIYEIDKIAKKVGIFLISTRSEAYRKF
jgi:mRNA-degrading endonuclease RelE of RelBE toxin-antitoxin system